jgi:5'-nucleotidase
MPVDFSGKLVVAISSRALFDLHASHQVYERDGVEAYARYQIELEDEPLAPGPAFGLVKKLLMLNRADSSMPVEVILISRNSADTGLRVFQSIEHHQLAISRAAFTSGESPWRYAQAFGAHLFLSTHADDVTQALQAGMAAATIVSPAGISVPTDQLRIAFDGDAVLFSDESERVFQDQGLAAFQKRERDAAKEPLVGGPFKSFLSALHALQQRYPAPNCPIRTALITARSAPAHERVIRTLRSWGIRLDEALFLGGLSKAAFLQAFEADIFFDDQQGHIDAAKSLVPSAHVPNGVTNE